MSLNYNEHLKGLTRGTEYVLNVFAIGINGAQSGSNPLQLPTKGNLNFLEFYLLNTLVTRN